MPQIVYSISGTVLNVTGTTLQGSASLTAKNTITGESHSSNDSGFSQLLTNSSGEWAVNLGSFTNESSTGDIIQITAVKTINGIVYSDVINHTVVANVSGITGLKLYIANASTLRYQTVLANKGEEVTYRAITLTQDDSPETTVTARTTSDTTITAFFQMISDFESIEREGRKEISSVRGFFKVGDAIAEGNLIQIGTQGDKWYTIKGVERFAVEDNPHHDEAELVLLDE